MTMTTNPNKNYKEILDDLYKEYGTEGTWKVLAQAGGYETVPPTIEQFINDPEFLGGIYGFNLDTGHPTVFPYWMNALKEVFPDPFNSPYLEIITTGATGQGKSLFSMIGALYDICKLLHVRNPHAKYAVAKTDKITLMLMNATMNLSKGVLYEQMMMALYESPFFKKKMALAGKYSLLEKNIDIEFGSRASSALGRLIFATIISEINFQNKTLTQAADNYNGIRQRLRSRFQTQFAYPGRIWIDSSKSETGSFIEDALLKGRSKEEMATVRLFDNPRWEVLPPWKLPPFNGYFKVFKGNENRDPFIVEREDQLLGIDESQVISVPKMYESDFIGNIQQSLQNIAGVSTQATHKFIPSVEKIDACFDHENPVTREIVALDMKNEKDILINYIDFSKIKTDSRPRFIHIDLAYADGGDKTGIASTRLDGISTISRLDSSTGKMVTIHEPVFHTDFVIAIEAKSGQEVPIYKLENFLVDLKSRNYKIAMVTMDGFQSKYMLQNLGLKGFLSEILSVDRTLDPYIEFKQAIMNDRWHSPSHPILIEEIKRLELVKGQKVDHPIKGSKDLADAVAASIYNAKLRMAELRANTTSEDLIGALSRTQKPSNIYDSLLDSMGLFDPNNRK